MRLKILVPFISCLAFLSAQESSAQRLQTLLNALGSNQTSPYARLLFYEIDDQLCLFIGSQRGPGALSANQLRIQLVSESGRAPLDFNLKGKVDGKDKDFLVWERCIPALGTAAKEGRISVEIRQRKAQTRTTAIGRQANKNKMPYPGTGAAQGFDIYRSSTGLLQWSNRIQEAPTVKLQTS